MIESRARKHSQSRWPLENLAISELRQQSRRKHACQLISILFLQIRMNLNTYPGSGRPGLPAFQADPAINVRNRQELGDAGMCHHFRLRFSQDTHGHGVSKKASDSPFPKACLLSKFIKRDLTTRRYHIWDLVATDCVDADQVGDLEVLVQGKCSSGREEYSQQRI